MFDIFTEDEKNLLVALPYRTGLWLSTCDGTGGSDADEAEMQALHDIVTGFAQDFLKSEFVQGLMEQTIAKKSEWPDWGRGLDAVPDECRRAVDILSPHLDRKQLDAFKRNLIEIATDVALAYRENEDGSLSGQVNVYYRLVSEKVRSVLTGRPPRSLDELLNISESEQAALDQLADALNGAGRKSATRDAAA